MPYRTEGSAVIGMALPSTPAPLLSNGRCGDDGHNVSMCLWCRRTSHLQLRATEEELARMVGDSDRAKLYKDEIVRQNAAINELERAMI